MKNQLRNYLLSVLFALLVIVSCFAFTSVIKNAKAQTEVASETDYLMESCSDFYYDKHGNGREIGGTDILSNGCRNYIGNGFYYGTNDIPFWINMSEINKISNIEQREKMLNEIRVQIEMWNTAFMYGGAGKLVNIYEVYSANKPNDVNGRKVIEVLPYDFLHDEDKTNDKFAGEFDRTEYTVKIGYNFVDMSLAYNNYTVMHEFGHVLGLADIDRVAGTAIGTHKTLMGYSNSKIMISYSDIQGVALATGQHNCSNSNLMRYVYDDGKYKHICFYCDLVSIRDSIIPGSYAIESNDGCTHDYQSFVSFGETRWEKCTKCYKVKECNDFNEIKDKNILLYSFNSNNLNFNSIKAGIGELMPKYDRFAPKKTGCAFDGYCDILGKKYYQMKVVNDEQTASLNLEEYYFVEKIVPVQDMRWDKDSKSVLYPIWKPLVGEYVYNNRTNDSILSTTTVQLNYGKNIISPIEIKNYKFKYFVYGDKQFSSLPTEIDIKIERSTSKYDIDTKKDFVNPDRVLYAYYEEDSCLAQGSLITLADGRQVAVENLTGNEMLLVWNLYTGTYDTAPILFIDSDPLSVYKVINLTFSDDTTVKVISEHGFWDYDLNKYVYINESNANNYIRHWFNKGETKVQLTAVDINEEYTSAYSPVTYGHLCYFVNGMLSMPGGIDGLFNIFDVDAETMKYDEISMQLDIETYGLFTYEEFTTYLNLPEEVFMAFNAQYFKVAIGKGLITVDRLSSLYERYADLLA